jgi:hypothetical protein
MLEHVTHKSVGQVQFVPLKVPLGGQKPTLLQETLLVAVLLKSVGALELLQVFWNKLENA